MPKPTTTVEVVFNETPTLISGDAIRTNLILNPTYEVDVSTWTTTGGATLARSTAYQVSGVASALVTSTITDYNGMTLNSRITVSPSTAYTLSAYCRNISGSTRSIYIGVQWYTAGGAFISEINSGSAGTLSVAAGWVRRSTTGTSPANAASAQIFMLSGTTGLSAGWQSAFDAVLFEQSSTLLPYFDGAGTAPYTNYALSRLGWNGTPNASTSTGYWASTLATNAAFTLDDTTKGVLNNPFYLLDGSISFVDVTSDVQQVSINRGRSRQLDEYRAGSAQITFDNDSRAYDPLNTGSPHYPYVIPRRYVRIKSNGISIFAGLINQWSIEYQPPQQSTVTASCADAFALLAAQTIDTYTPDEQLSGARVSEILSRPEVNFVGTSVLIDAGTSTLGAFTIDDNTNALGYLHQIERSEQGYLFSSKDNTLRFRDSASVVSQTGSVAFTDDGTGTSGYMTLDVETGDELLYNRIVAASPAGVEQVVSDSASIAQYDTITLQQTDLLNSQTTEVLAIANLLLSQYKTPEVRYTGITQQLGALGAAAQNALLGLDLTDLATVKRTYTTGTPASVTRYVLVEGISHQITPTAHKIAYRFGSIAQAGFILNSGTFGLLDVGSLS